MHFVTGGAFNGKSKWINEYYQLRDTPHVWISGYHEAAIPEKPPTVESIIVMEGIEVWLKFWTERLNIQEARDRWQLFLHSWLQWEKETVKRKIILIGTDISKGIVPMLPEQRKWRDMTGWAYQDAVKVAERVDLIWYGINQQIK